MGKPKTEESLHLLVSFFRYLLPFFYTLICIAMWSDSSLSQTGHSELVSKHRNDLAILKNNLISTDGKSGNHIYGNIIGTDVTVSKDVGNLLDGIMIEKADENVVGGNNAGEANIIAFNKQNGISIQTSIGNVIASNLIHSNHKLGIDLNRDGITPNDSGDVDGGANFLQNYPALSDVVLQEDSIKGIGVLFSRPRSVYHLEFFSNRVSRLLLNPQAEEYLGSVDVATDDSGSAQFKISFPKKTGQLLSMTSTATSQALGTSEISPAFTVRTDPSRIVLSLPMDSTHIISDTVIFQWYRIPFWYGRYLLEISSDSAWGKVRRDTSRSYDDTTMFVRGLPTNKYFWRVGITDGFAVQGISIARVVSVQARTSVLDQTSSALQYSLSDNFPNPFNSSTQIQFSLAKKSRTRLSILDVLGRQIAVLVDGEYDSGIYRINWNAPQFASGIYFYRLEAGDFVTTKKLMLIK
jgi:hypothetical protein